MRITESQLRRVIKRMLKEQAGGNLPQVGDHYEPSQDREGFVTDQARDASGKNFYLQRRWNVGDVVEVIDVVPSEEFAFGRGMTKAPDLDDKLMPSDMQKRGMPTQPLKGTASSYRVHFKALQPPVKPMVDVISGKPYPAPPKNCSYEMEVSRFLRLFQPA